MSENMKQVWHTPVLRSLDANQTAQASDPSFVTDDSSAHDYVGTPDVPGPDGSGALDVS